MTQIWWIIFKLYWINLIGVTALPLSSLNCKMISRWFVNRINYLSIWLIIGWFDEIVLIGVTALPSYRGLNGVAVGQSITSRSIELFGNCCRLTRSKVAISFKMAAFGNIQLRRRMEQTKKPSSYLRQTDVYYRHFIIINIFQCHFYYHYYYYYYYVSVLLQQL